MSSTQSPNAISSHIAIRPDWLGRRREPALEPDLPIVDPHHHLIDRPESGTYLLTDLLKDIADGGHNVIATVYLEWLSMYRADGPVEMRPVGEIEFANGVAAKSASGGYGKPRVCAGIVGHADLTLGARVRDVLEAMIGSGGGRFRGIRFISASHPDQAQWGATAIRPEGWLLDKKVREGFAQLGPLGLSFDAFMYHTQLPDLLDLARAFPATPIVMNHVGGPIGLGRYKGKRDEVFAEWNKSIRALAACPNVHVKLGGLGMRLLGFDVHDGELPPSSPPCGGPTSRPASKLSAPTAPCSKAISPSTRAPTATARSGTPASGWPREPAPPRRRTCSAAPRRGSTASASEPIVATQHAFVLSFDGVLPNHPGQEQR